MDVNDLQGQQQQQQQTEEPTLIDPWASPKNTLSTPEARMGQEKPELSLLFLVLYRLNEWAFTLKTHQCVSLWLMYLRGFEMCSWLGLLELC